MQLPGADALLAARAALKKPAANVISDKSAPQLSGYIGDEQVASYQNSALDANIERWFPLIADLTFPTEFVPISIADAEAFRDAWLELEEKKLPDLSAPLKERVKALQTLVEEAIDKVCINAAPEKRAVFVKTSSRSPKDASILMNSFRTAYHCELTRTATESKAISDPKNLSENEKIKAMLQVAMNQMKVTSGPEALWLLCHSERIYQDMLLALDHTQRFKEHIVVRQWIDLHSGFEFRGFAADGKLNALSQYNHFVLYPELLAIKDELCGRITRFFNEQVSQRLREAFPQYVIDFAVTDPGTPHEKIWVIEINPFLSTTEACLFSWTREQELLEKGPFEFRVRDKIASGVKADLMRPWRELLEESNGSVSQ